MATRTWAPPGPYDLGRTLGVLARGPGDPAYRVAPDGSVWRSSRTPAGPGTLHVKATANGIEAEAWGPGAPWLLDTLPALLGATDTPEAFVPRHRLLHEAHRRNPGLRLARTGLVLESLIPSILEQKVTSDEAYRAWRLLLQRHGDPAPGPMPGLRVMPDPKRWALIPSWEWHKAGVDTKRASTIIRAARVAPRLEEAAAMDDQQASARLQAIPGIGPWTTAETLQRSNGAADAVTTGDLHLPKIIGYALTGARGTDDEGMLELLAPYEGQRHRACRLILLTGQVPPRRAPRFPVGNIAPL
ncbi:MULTISPECIES: DNA-3-methyladenine glycosylase family protein [Streptomyces]|uniref:DNA-3-methyladenine glycosylase 2 family protein n=1 Tax=Streptomyces morookaense TaxID=1970 RepID=A0A7Y7E8S6_STRMO|nr:MULTISPECIES: DNA-3-methyladenine glycosylase 2 family protein [Streptomyces]MCC2278537.1 DNA-3-methyladenine glycosylase 2 family protein [Streptomyces sp. ET3-23]NVK80313.1 DNA-3-methyladenine glycosylase 2 family protein [Streptomyces morookaense]GHF11061.1 3-methyladenine DNA glycosylase [Streptomyces morookaense]